MSYCPEMGITLENASRFEGSALFWMTIKDHHGNAAFVEAKLQDDDEITSVEVQRLISRNFSVDISAPTIRRYGSNHWILRQPDQVSITDN